MGFALVGPLVCLTFSTGAAQERESTEPRDEGLRERIEYFLRQRAYPFDRIPAGALQRASTRYTPFHSRATTSLMAVTQDVWTSIGPSHFGNDVGRVSALAVDPRNDEVIYVGAASGGVWKTVDGGHTWTALTDGECSLSVGSITLDPANPNFVYVGTGENNGTAEGYTACGILRSFDGGKTWTHLGGTSFRYDWGGVTIGRIVIDPTSAGSTTNTKLLAGTSDGLYRSTDSGASWVQVLDGSVSDLLASPNNPRLLFAGIRYGRTPGVLRSSDGGLTWSQLSGLPSENGRIALAIAPSSPAVLYAAFSRVSTGGLLGVYRTSDSGNSWSQVSASGVSCGAQCWYDLALTVSPANPDVVYFSGFSLYRSADGGSTFVNVGGVHVDHHALVFRRGDPNRFLVGSDGGIYRTEDQGNTWTSLNTNLSITQFYPGISTHPTQPQYAMGGTQDNGTLRFAGDPEWHYVAGGDGGFTVVDQFHPSITMVETQWLGGGGPLRRDESVAGSYYERVTTGIDFGDDALFIPPLVASPLDSRVVYFGTEKLYRTINQGDLWTSFGPPSGIEGIVTAIAPSPSDPLTVYFGTTWGRVLVTRDGGQSWTGSGSGWNLGRYVTDLAVDPQDPARAFVTLSGFQTLHVYMTLDGGQSWTPRSNGLPDIPTNAVALIGPGELYIGTDVGVFHSGDEGATWQPAMAGLPNVIVTDLAFDPPAGRLLAATYGRGMFAFPISIHGLRGDLNGDHTASAVDAQAILASLVGIPLPHGWSVFPGGDTNCDRDITALDAQILLSVLVGITPPGSCVGEVR